jgi:hypothetical protein
MACCSFKCVTKLALRLAVHSKKAPPGLVAFFIYFGVFLLRLQRLLGSGFVCHFLENSCASQGGVLWFQRCSQARCLLLPSRYLTSCMNPCAQQHTNLAVATDFSVSSFSLANAMSCCVSRLVSSTAPSCTLWRSCGARTQWQSSSACGNSFVHPDRQTDCHSAHSNAQTNPWSLPSLKPIGYNWSYLACRIGQSVPI